MTQIRTDRSLEAEFREIPDHESAPVGEISTLDGHAPSQLEPPEPGYVPQGRRDLQVAPLIRGYPDTLQYGYTTVPTLDDQLVLHGPESSADLGEEEGFVTGIPSGILVGESVAVPHPAVDIDRARPEGVTEFGHDLPVRLPLAQRNDLGVNRSCACRQLYATPQGEGEIDTQILEGGQP